MQEYPKALYFGTAQAHQHKIVNGVEHEAELRELGFVDFADLEKDTVKSMDESASGSASSEDFKNAFVPVEQFDEVSEALVQKETQLGVAQGERDFYIKENEDLKLKLGELDKLHEGVLTDLAKQHEAYLELGNAAKDVESRHVAFFNDVDAMKARIAELEELAATETPTSEPDYSNATAKELREALDTKGIKYLQRDNVDTLRALLTQPEKTEE